MESPNKVNVSSLKLGKDSAKITNYVCIRCGLDFFEKQHLKQHLKKKIICMPIELNVDRNIQLDELIKTGIKCDKCNGFYKNEASLRKHISRYHFNKIKEEVILKETDIYPSNSCNTQNENKLSNKELVELVHTMKNMIQELLKNPPSFISKIGNC